MKLTADLRRVLRERRDCHVRGLIEPRVAVTERDRLDGIVTLDLLIALSKLTMDEREVWVDRHILGRTLERTGRGMKDHSAHEPDRIKRGLSRERVRTLEHNAKRKMSRFAEGLKSDAGADAA